MVGRKITLGKLPELQHYILRDRQPVPATFEQWMDYLGNEMHHVAFTEIGPHCHVSTIFLGIDHGFGYGERPILFETMVFGGAHDREQWRCSTYAEAMEQHEAAVELAR